MNLLWKCNVCGYVHEGIEAPNICPKCGAPKEKFVQLTGEESEKIYKSDRTNDIHMELIALTTKLDALCKEGIGINLDSTCVIAFKQAKDESWVIKQRSKAELAAHMQRGKW